MTARRSLGFGGLAAGSAQVLAAEALALPLGVLLAAFLTRRLGPSGYGVYALAATTIAWIEWTVASMFSRAIVREASRAPADDRLAAAAVQLAAMAGVASAILVAVAAPLVASLTGEPRLTAALRVFACDIPLFTVATAHRSVLIGRGQFLGRALAPAVRWSARLVAIVAFVWQGWGLNGVLVGIIVASAIEIAVLRRFARVPLGGGGRNRWALLLADALPFVGLSLTLRLFDRVDLILLKVLGGTTAAAGVYGAAQGLAQALSLVSIAFPPLLLAALTRLHAEGRVRDARRLSTDAVRVVLWLLPLVGLAHASGPALSRWLFGPSFGDAGSLLAPLLITAVLQVLVAVLIMALTASGYPHLLLGPGVVTLLTAIAGSLWLIPRAGAVGAALATTIAAVEGAFIATWLACRLGTLKFPTRTFLRAIAATVVADMVVRATLDALGLPLSLAIGVLAALCTGLALGELDRSRLHASPSLVSAPPVEETW